MIQKVSSILLLPSLMLQLLLLPNSITGEAELNDPLLEKRELYNYMDNPPPPTPAPVPPPAPQGNFFSSQFDLIFETLEDGSTANVDEVVRLLDDAYNNVIARYENAFDRQMVCVTLLGTPEVLPPDDDGRRQLQRRGRVRARVTASGRCSGCGSSAKFTNQVSGRKLLLEEAEDLKEEVSTKEDDVTTASHNNVRRRRRTKSTSRSRSGKGGSSGGKGGGGYSSGGGSTTTTSPPPPSPAVGGSTSSGTIVVRSGPNGSTVIESPNGETTVVSEGRLGGGVNTGTGSSGMPENTTGGDNPTVIRGTTIVGRPETIVGGQDSSMGNGADVDETPTTDDLPSEEEVRQEYSRLIANYDSGNVVDVLVVDEL